jgi:hypothetical protein
MGRREFGVKKTMSLGLLLFENITQDCYSKLIVGKRNRQNKSVFYVFKQKQAMPAKRPSDTKWVCLLLLEKIRDPWQHC